jgi:Virulence factor BrkB
MAKKLARIIAAAVERFFADQCPQLAAGIAYRVLFSIAPLAIVLVSIFGLVLHDDSVRRDVVDAIVDALPVSVAGGRDVEDAITAIATPASAAGLASLLVFTWAASGMMTAISGGSRARDGGDRVKAAGARETRRSPRWPCRSDRHRPAAAADLARLGVDLRGDDPAERRVRLAHDDPRLPLLGKVSPADEAMSGKSPGPASVPRSVPLNH